MTPIVDHSSPTAVPLLSSFTPHFNLSLITILTYWRGIRVVSKALLVKEAVNCIEADCKFSSSPKVCNYLDMICESGYGRLLAIMCGILVMTGGELVEEFVNLFKVMFLEGLDTPRRTGVLKQEIKKMIGKYSTCREEGRIFCQNDTYKTFVWAAAFQILAVRLFRNFHVHGNPHLDYMFVTIMRGILWMRE
ncbi:hypothetical protein DL96DRAFT_1689338 [Flagelloscypha sp. PMI_526]|nr:hypothetical protein DL96DRAFT_1689338 [Flagelloscypha sp. PMI_526]